MEIRIVIADDHKVLRDGLCRLLNDQPDFRVVGEADNGRAAVKLAGELSPNVVLMDARMPDLNGIDATRQIFAADPSIKIICLSAQVDHRTAREMLTAGAAGYLSKDCAFDELTKAIRAVVSGKIYLSATIAGMVVDDYVNVKSDGGAKTALSSREREVLQLIAEGKATKEVAAHLLVSVKTVETHRRNLMEKLKIDSVAELTKYAIREGITSV